MAMIISSFMADRTVTMMSFPSSKAALRSSASLFESSVPLGSDRSS